MKTKLQSKTYKNYVNHEWVTSKKTREIINPFNGDPIAIVPEASKKDVDEAIAAAREAFDRGPWRDFTAQQRGRILFAMADIVRKNAAMLAELETVNCGKPIVESEFDMNDTASCFEYYGGLATKIHGETLPVPDNALNMTLREPVAERCVACYLIGEASRDLTRDLDGTVPLHPVGDLERAVRTAAAAARPGTAEPGGFAERRAQRRDRRRSDSRPCHCRIDAGR